MPVEDCAGLPAREAGNSRLIRQSRRIADHLSLGEPLEILVLCTFTGRNLFSEPALALVGS